MRGISIALKKVNKDGTAVLEVDGKEMMFNDKTKLDIITEVPRQEIVEEGISEIEIAASSSFNRSYQPVGGTAKWFRDELGQLWVKFRVLYAREEYDHVVPAARVVHVRYLKKGD